MLTRSQLSHVVSLWLLDFRKLSVEQLMFWNRKADKLLINIDDGKTVQVLKSPRVECWSWYPSSPHSQLPRLFAPSPNRLSRWSLCWSSDHSWLFWFVWSSPNIDYHDDHSVDHQTIHDCLDCVIISAQLSSPPIRGLNFLVGWHPKVLTGTSLSANSLEKNDDWDYGCNYHVYGHVVYENLNGKQ